MWVNNIRGGWWSRWSSCHVVSLPTIKDDALVSLWPPPESSSAPVWSGRMFRLIVPSGMCFPPFVNYFNASCTFKLLQAFLWINYMRNDNIPTQIYLWYIPVNCMTHNVRKQFGTNFKGWARVFPPRTRSINKQKTSTKSQTITLDIKADRSSY